MINRIIVRIINVLSLAVIGLLLITCNKEYESGPLGANYTIPTYYFHNTIEGYVYRDCNNTPAVNTPIALYEYGINGNVSLGSYVTDNTGHYSIPYTYSVWTNEWTPGNPYWLYLPNDSIYVGLPYDTMAVYNSSHDTSVTIANRNIILNDSSRNRIVFKFNQPYTNKDTLFYTMYPENYTPQFVIGPFPSRVLVNYNIPVKHIWLNPKGADVEFNYGLGMNKFNYGSDRQFFNYKPCSMVDSIAITYY